MAIVLVSGILLTACQKADASKDPSLDLPISETPSPDPVEAFPQSSIEALTDYVSEEELALAHPWNTSDNSALASVMKKALSGEDITIACIGGSITQGTISTGISDSLVGFKKGYADLFFQWWSDTFPETDFTFINAGIGATDSYLGVHRVQKDVLDYHPDLVLVEFSVNDGSSVIDKRNYDNLVRRILLSESRPAVMLLFMGQTNGSTAQDIHSLIGFNYKLPMVSYINVIHHMMDENLYTGQQLSGDTVHPSALGHAIAGEILWKYLNDVYTVKDSFSEPETFNSKAVTLDVYLDSEILDSTS
ncbi:MAG: SGNH/GDSL hydrolase family protein, partial [Lachnospiraceae bacterium]|nr:SGNH/GDSL hydrolase family protein [Lachnospiraceae bacterium]